MKVVTIIAMLITFQCGQFAKREVSMTNKTVFWLKSKTANTIRKTLQFMEKENENV